MKKIIGGMAALGLSALLFGAAFGAELEHNGKTFGWQDREYSGRAEMELTGGEAESADSGDAGAAASSGDSGNGDSGGESCGDK